MKGASVIRVVFLCIVLITSLNASWAQNFAGGSYDGNGMALLKCGATRSQTGGSYDGSNLNLLLCGITRTVKGSAYEGSSSALVRCGSIRTEKGGGFEGSHTAGLYCGGPRVIRGGFCSGDYFQLSFCTGETYLLKPCVSTLLLPVELTGFTAQCIFDRVVLNWQTASEHTNDHFILERAMTSTETIRSGDGLNWVLIGEIPGYGTSSIEHWYTYDDILPAYITGQPEKIHLYYRITQVDRTGSHRSYFPLVMQYPCTQKSIPAVIYSNPGSGIFYISGHDPGLEIEIYNLVGQRVRIEKLQPDHSIDLSGLATGIYILRTYQDGPNEPLSYKICIGQ